MAQQTIDVGTAPNDGNGEPLRDAFVKVNDNFDELYGYLSTGALVVGNSTVNTVVSNTGGLVTVDSSTNTSTVVNTSIIRIGNGTSNVVSNSSQISLLSNSVIGNTVVNSSIFAVGNSTANSYISQTNVKISSTTTNTNFYVNSSVLMIGNSSVNSVANSTRLTVAQTNITSNTLLLGSGSTGSSVGTSDFANGYSRLPNGLLMQWGYNAAVNSVANVTTFSSVGCVAFTNIFSVSATSTTNGISVSVTAANTTSITLLANSTSNTGIYWNAIGK